LGHTTPNLTLAIYAREMDRRDGEPERLKALVEGVFWAAMGSKTALHDPRAAGTTGDDASKTAPQSHVEPLARLITSAAAARRAMPAANAVLTECSHAEAGSLTI